MNIPLVKLLDLFSFFFRSYHFNCFAHMSEKNLKVIFGQKLLVTASKRIHQEWTLSIKSDSEMAPLKFFRNKYTTWKGWMAQLPWTSWFIMAPKTNRHRTWDFPHRVVVRSLSSLAATVLVDLSKSFSFSPRSWGNTHKVCTWYPKQPCFNRLFQLDDPKSLLKKWLFHQTSIEKWLFRVPGTYDCVSKMEAWLHGFMASYSWTAP